jgi:hypothetical protein
MHQVDQEQLAFAVAKKVLRKPQGAGPRAGGASYKAATFIDYFRGRNRDAFRDEQLQEYIARPRCIASSHALYAGHLNQSAATWYVRDELQEIFDLRLDRNRFWSFPEQCVELVTHVARYFYLPTNDPAKPLFDKALVRSLSETYKSELGLYEPAIWRVRVARFESGPASTLHDASPTHREHRDFDEYLRYWRATHARKVDDLLRNRLFCAGLHALTLRAADNTTLSPVLSALDGAFADKLHPLLFRRLRHHLYVGLAADVGAGLLKLPRGLRSEFPDIYTVERSRVSAEQEQ